jgi:hypothetical protein
MQIEVKDTDITDAICFFEPFFARLNSKHAKNIIINNIIRFAKKLIAKFDADFESLKSLQTILQPTKIEAFDTELKVNNSIFPLPSFSA